MLPGLISILLLVLATGFFVASEFALVSVRKTRIEQIISEGNPQARQVKYAIEHLQIYLAVTQVGVTLASLGLGYIGEPVLSQIFVPLIDDVLPRQVAEAFISAHGIAFIISFLIVTIVEIILGELVPKMIARQRAEQTALTLIRPLNFFAFIFKPLVWLINLLGDLVLRLIRLPHADEFSNVHSVEELEMLVSSSRQAGVLEEEEEAILRRVFDLGDLTARQVMVPRTEVTGISVSTSIDEMIETMRNETHSRFPVYEGDLDNIVGMLYVKDVFTALTERVGIGADGASTNGVAHEMSPRTLMRNIEQVPETMSANELLAFMQKKRVQIAVVIDEYGGTSGIVTLEDVFEEIVGDVQDEFDDNEAHPDFYETPEGTLINGLTAITDVNEQLGMNMQGDSDTLGGFVFEQLGRKPELGDEVSVDGHVLRIEALDGLRVAEVRVIPRGRSSGPPPNGDEE